MSDFENETPDPVGPLISLHKAIHVRIVMVDPEIRKAQLHLNRSAATRARKALKTIIDDAKKLRKDLLETTRKEKPKKKK